MGKLPAPRAISPDPGGHFKARWRRRQRRNAAESRFNDNKRECSLLCRLQEQGKRIEGRGAAGVG